MASPVPPEYLVDLCDMAGGYGRAFPSIAKITLDEAARDDTWRVQVQSLVNWCARPIKHCAGLGIKPAI